MYDVHVGIEERMGRSCEGVGMNTTITNAMTTKGNQGTFQPQAIQENLGMWPTEWTGFPTTDWAQSIVIGQSMVGRSYSNSTFRPWWATQSPFGDKDHAAFAAGVHLRGGDVGSYLDIFAMDDSQGLDVCFIDQAGTTIAGHSNNGAYYCPINNYGLGRPGTEAAVGTGEVYASNCVLKPTIKGGVPVYERSTHLNFQVPLLCPIFGATAAHGKLMPMRIFDGMEMEFLVNPYAFFTGGGGDLATKTNAAYNATQYDAQSYKYSQILSNRFKWAITKFELIVEVTYPPIQETEAIYANLNSSGFQLDFKTWFLGPKTKYAGGIALNNTIQINNGFNSLDTLMFYFQPADYEIYPYCRKHKRISNNLTSMQLRIGGEYYPSLPITGHAGNIRPDFQSATQRGNYMEFFVQTMKAMGKWLGGLHNGLINPTNYTLNHVGYNPADVATGYTLPSTKNTMADMSLFWENNCVPRSLFAIDLEKFDLLGDRVKSGWDTRAARPFDLLLENDSAPITFDQYGSLQPDVGGVTTATLSNTSFPRPYYMYIWMNYCARITWSGTEGWMVEGRV
jgi:hypothetical protein